MGGKQLGWVKLHRQFIDSAIWRDFALMRFWIWCLLKASHKPTVVTVGKVKVSLQPGQFIFTRSMASMETGLSEKVVRTCLDVLGHEMDPSLGRERARRFSVITIMKWDDYQIGESAKGHEKSVKGPRNGPSTINRITRSKEDQGEKRAVVDVTWTGEKLMVPAVLMEKYTTKYPRLDVASIIIDVERWLLKNPDKAAGYKSLDSFLNNWLRREVGKTTASLDAYEVSEADAAIQLQFERDLAAGKVANV